MVGALTVAMDAAGIEIPHACMAAICATSFAPAARAGFSRLRDRIRSLGGGAGAQWALAVALCAAALRVALHAVRKAGRRREKECQKRERRAEMDRPDAQRLITRLQSR